MFDICGNRMGHSRSAKLRSRSPIALEKGSGDSGSTNPSGMTWYRGQASAMIEHEREKPGGIGDERTDGPKGQNAIAVFRRQNLNESPR